MGALRNPRALVLPFYSDGYDEALARQHIRRLEALLRAQGIDVESAAPMKSVAEAEACAGRHHPGDCDFPVLFPVTWASPTLAVCAARYLMDRPMLIWSVSEFALGGARTEMSSAPAAAALMGVFAELGAKCEFISDFPDRGELCMATRDQLAAFAGAARAVECLKHTCVGCFGAYFNGISSAAIDPAVVRRRFGAELLTFDVYELIRRMAEIDPEGPRFAKWRADAAQRLERLPDRRLAEIGRMVLALQDYIDENNLRALSVRCHTELSQCYGTTACLPLSLLADRLTCSCEADWPVTLTQVMLHDLAGGETATYVDLRTFDLDGMSAGACGFAPCGMVEGGVGCPNPADDPLNLAGEGYVTNARPFREGRVTLARLVKLHDGKLAMHTALAEAVAEASPLRELGCPPYPMTRLVPDVPVAQFTRHLGGNHYALVYGDVRAALARFCAFTGVELLA